MKNTIYVAAALTLALAASGCGDKNKKAQAKNAQPVPEQQVTLDTPASTGEDVRNGLPDPNGAVTLATIYFDLDTSLIAAESKEILQRNAAVLKDNATVKVRLEGHADERGSTQYNVGLGDRRANAVKEYLVSLGVPATNLEVVSYGEERAADAGHDEAAWAKNRRVELAVTAGADRVSSSYSTTTK